ncbi:MAG: GNAT family N-acetyltransferase [Eubacteriales bacterium]|nr:GNAT family N-acetyltransferase [Eubacteriales bacterium]
MIRKIEKRDIDAVADIWLNTNLKAHDFIDEAYWKSNYDMVKEMFTEAEIYVYEQEEKVLGFIGLSDDYIEGIFVSCDSQSGGIGKALVDFVKEKREKLSLNVYDKNTRAVRFYEREGFTIISEGTDRDTGEKDLEMLWHR